MAKFKEKFIGYGQPTWDMLCDNTWDTECDIIWSDCEPIIERIKLRGGSRGGLRKAQDCWNEWDKLNWRNKRKLYRCICMIKGIKCELQREVKDFDVTVEDIQMLLEEYEKRKFNIEVSNIKVE